MFAGIVAILVVAVLAFIVINIGLWLIGVIFGNLFAGIWDVDE